jgi:predicted enzyme related to lactoylglutathione lyase
MSKSSMIILYVSDQDRSMKFYENILDQEPVLNVPGMTEFQLGQDLLLGLMPESSIEKIICPMLPKPSLGNGIPRSELYLIVADPVQSLAKALSNGAKPVSAAEKRSWGDTVAYCADPDGHVIAFAS